MIKRLGCVAGQHEWEYSVKVLNIPNHIIKRQHRQCTVCGKKEKENLMPRGPWDSWLRYE